jgi:hypothetical protein
MYNRRCILVAGTSTAGKSASLEGLQNQEGVLYLNCEAGKDLPFAHNFKEVVVLDPLAHVYAAFDTAETRPDIHTIVIDTATFLMDMYESMYVLTSPNTMKAWGDYAQYFKRLMQHYVAKSTKRVIILAHHKQVLNESTGVYESFVPVKGSLANNGIEAFFTNVLVAKRVSISTLEAYSNPYLNISEDDRELGYKHVFQTRPTKSTVGDRIRVSMGLWNKQETFIDNNCQLVMDKIDALYAKPK